MKYILGFLLVLLMACNSGNKNNDGYTEDSLPNPEKVNPPSDAIPADMKIKKDSVVVVDTSALHNEMNTIRKENADSGK